MHDNSSYLSFRDYLAIIRRHRVLIVVVTLAVAGAAVAWSLAQDEVYEAEASLSFREATQDVEFIGLPPIRNQTPEQRAAVGAERANRRAVLLEVKQRLDLERSVEELAEDVEARAEVRTNLVVIQAQSEGPRRAARLANAVGREVIRLERQEVRDRFDEVIAAAREELRRMTGNDPVTQVRRGEFRQRIAQLRTVRDSAVPVEFVQPARVPEDPIAPQPVRNGILGGFVGLLLGIALAFVRWGLDRRVRGARQIAQRTDLPILGATRRARLGRDPGPNGHDPADRELFRMMHGRIERLADPPPRRILVTSAVPGEGKTTVASQLAAAPGSTGRRTLLIEGDLRRPQLAGRLGLGQGPGLVDYLEGRAQPQDVVQALPIGAGGNGNGAHGAAIAVLPAGSPSERPVELLRSQAFRDFMAQVAESYDTVVIDAPPLLVVADALELIEHADAVVVCLRAGQTTGDQLGAAVDALSRGPRRPTGLVVTGVPTGEESAYGQYAYSHAGAYHA